MSFLNYIDERTLNIVYLMCQFTIAVSFILIFPVYKKKYLQYFTIGFVISAIASFIISIQNVIHNRHSLLVGNILLIIGLYIIHYALIIMVGKVVSYKIFVSLLVLFIMGHITFLYIIPDEGYRIINFSIFTILGTSVVFIKYISHLRHKLKMIPIIIMILYSLQSLLLMWRIINIVRVKQLEAIYSSSDVFKNFILVSIIVTVVRSMCIILYNTTEIIKAD